MHRKLLQENIPEAVLFIIFCFIQYHHINIDFWNDEIYTLKHFTLTSFAKTLTDYHVPNNHIFFNFINNGYLKLINLTVLDELMDHPYKLRIVPFFYSLLTLFYTYQIGKKFFSRQIALFASVVLITTIPFFNFSLQIRGYGLSTLLLTMIVYHSFLFSKSAKKIYLLFITLFTTFVVYTVPSNIYFLVSIVFIYGIYFMTYLRKQTLQKKDIREKIFNSTYFQILISIFFAVLISLALYSPIFKNVFMNDYVKPGAPFLTSSLRFYTSNIFMGFISNRWILVGASFIGVVFVFLRHKEWRFFIFLFFAILILPVLIVYARGYRAPLRTFVVGAPFFSLLIATGFCTLVDLIVRHKRILAGILLGVASIYAAFIFFFQLKKIDNNILNDIKQGGRAQNLYNQYYSFHYQPLEDVRSFKKQYFKNTLPVLVHGCEPHGISNYLDKFEILFSMTYYQPNALDSLLSFSDSIYVITNHPFQFDGIKEFETKRLNKDLTYHNIVLLTVSEVIKSKIKPQINILNEEFKDSINFLYNVYDSSFFKTRKRSDSHYFIDEKNKDCYGDLIQFVNAKPYICYLETQNHNADEIYYIITDSFNVIHDYKEINGIRFFLAQKSEKNDSSAIELFFNSFEDIENSDNSDVLLDSTTSYSGEYCERLGKENDFSIPFSFVLDEGSDHTIFKVSFMGSFAKDVKALVVMEVRRNEKQLIWKGNNINNFFNRSFEWQKVITNFNVKDTLMPDDRISIYVWSPEKEKLWIDDLKIERIK